MAGNLDHLDEDARSFVESDDEMRANYIKRPRWIVNPSAAKAIEMISCVFEQKSSFRPMNVLVVGAPASGKTALVDLFARKHDEEKNYKNGKICYPILKVTMPSEPDSDMFFENIYDALKVPHGAYEIWRSRRRLLRRFATDLLKRSQTRVLIIEDLHSIGGGTEREQIAFLQMLRVLGGELNIGFVFTGVPRVRFALRLEEQILASTREIELPKWKAGEALKSFSTRFLKTLPLRKPSRIDREFVKLLAERSEGRMDYLCDELRAAAITAIRSEREMVDLSVLQESRGYSIIVGNPPFSNSEGTRAPIKDALAA